MDALKFLIKLRLARLEKTRFNPKANEKLENKNNLIPYLQFLKIVGIGTIRQDMHTKAHIDGHISPGVCTRIQTEINKQRALSH